MDLDDSGRTVQAGCRASDCTRPQVGSKGVEISLMQTVPLSGARNLALAVSHWTKQILRHSIVKMIGSIFNCWLAFIFVNSYGFRLFICTCVKQYLEMGCITRCRLLPSVLPRGGFLDVG